MVRAGPDRRVAAAVDVGVPPAATFMARGAKKQHLSTVRRVFTPYAQVNLIQISLINLAGYIILVYGKADHGAGSLWYKG
jgi:hypothetical protein